MKNPFSLVSKKSEPRVVRFIDQFPPKMRAVWDSLTAEERVVVMRDMATSPNPPLILDRDGKTKPFCAGTLTLVVDNALGITPAQYVAMAKRIQAQFAQAADGS